MLWNRDIFQLFQIIPSFSKTDWKELQEEPWKLFTGNLGITFCLGIWKLICRKPHSAGRKSRKQNAEARNRSLIDMSDYHFSGFLSITLIFLTWKFSTETYFSSPISIWKGKMQWYSTRVHETASSDFLQCSVYVTMIVIRRNMPTLRCTSASQLFYQNPVETLTHITMTYRLLSCLAKFSCEKC